MVKFIAELYLTVVATSAAWHCNIITLLVTSAAPHCNAITLLVTSAACLRPFSVISYKVQHTIIFSRKIVCDQLSTGDY